MIPLRPITGSSSIAAMAHDPATNVLAIQFKGRGDNPGAVHHYQHVSAETAAELVSAKSPGNYFAINIRSSYPSEKIVDELQVEGEGSEV